MYLAVGKNILHNRSKLGMTFNQVYKRGGVKKS